MIEFKWILFKNESNLLLYYVTLIVIGERQAGPQSVAFLKSLVWPGFPDSKADAQTETPQESVSDKICASFATKEED